MDGGYSDVVALCGVFELIFLMAKCDNGRGGRAGAPKKG
jgi:hypothetical protein